MKKETKMYRVEIKAKKPFSKAEIKAIHSAFTDVKFSAKGYYKFDYEVEDRNLVIVRTDDEEIANYIKTFYSAVRRKAQRKLKQ